MPSERAVAKTTSKQADGSAAQEAGAAAAGGGGTEEEAEAEKAEAEAEAEEEEEVEEVEEKDGNMSNASAIETQFLKKVCGVLSPRHTSPRV